MNSTPAEAEPLLTEAPALWRGGACSGGDVVDAAAASFRQAVALTAALRDGPPAVLVLDDIHWADAESPRLLRRVCPQVAAPPVVVVVELATRTDGNPFSVTELVRLLVREGAHTSLDARAWRAVSGGVRDVVRQRRSTCSSWSAPPGSPASRWPTPWSRP